MNERIKELARQAGEYAAQNATGDWEVGPDYQDIFNKKFAELIVRECASICELNGQSYKFSFTPAKAQLAESTSSYCGIMIKKHFGVEE